MGEIAGVIWLGMLVTVLLGVAALWIALLFAVGFAFLLTFAWVTK